MTRSKAPVLPSGDEKRVVVEEMFDRIAPRYERVNRVISFGQDVRWRRRTLVELAVPAGSTVADLACGTGDLCRSLAAAGHRVVGFDFSAGMLAAAHAGSPLVRADVLVLPVPDRRARRGHLWIRAPQLHRPCAVSGRVCRECLRPGGRLALLDAAEPRNLIMRAGHDLWFRRLVPWIGAALSDGPAYRYLPASTVYLPDPA